MSPRTANPSQVDVGQTAHELRLVLGQLVRRLRAEHRYPLMHASVLGRLDREGPMGTVDLAKAEGVRQQSMGQTLAELEAQGMVERRADPDDKRRTLLELTAAGRERLADERARRDGWLAQTIAAQLSRDEQKSLAKVVELLERLARG